MIKDSPHRDNELNEYKMPNTCDRCRERIEEGKKYLHGSSILCEDCYMAVRTTRARKTHWQYLKSIKTEYLRPAKTNIGK